MTLTTPQWIEATQAVDAATTILIVTHVKPDGDAIGSLMALTHILRERGKLVTPAVDDGVPEHLRYIPGTEGVISKLKGGKWDLMISVDASDEARTGVAGVWGRKRCPKVINLDHHPTNTMFGDLFIVVPDAVSSTEIVYDWMLHMGQSLAQPTAVALLTGLITDTRGLRTSNVKSRTLEIAQRLIEAGASLTEVVEKALDNTSYRTIQLWKRGLATVDMANGVIEATITQADLQEVGAVEATDYGLVSLLSGVNEAMVAIVYKEQPGNKVELSIRCKPGFDVGSVAFALGGGGHKQASGATIDGPLDDAKARVRPLLEEAVKQGTLTIV